MKALITGHMGTIGRFVGHVLKEKGYDVHGSDIRAGQDCRETFRINDLKYDLVVHCAADHPPARRLGTDADLIEWVDRTHPSKLVYISSEEVYPKGLQQEPYRMAPADLPDTANGMALYAAEQMVLQRDGLVFRPFQVYGEASRGMFDQLATQVRERRDPFVLANCGAVADYIHVEDAGRALMAAVESGYQGPPVNLCTGVPTARDELAEAMFAHIKWEPTKFQCAYPDYAYFLCGDSTGIDAIRKPTISLAEGIARELSPTLVKR